MLLDKLQAWRMYAIEKSDDRVKDWLLMGDPLPLIVIWVLYMSVVYFGPKYMADKKAWSLRPLIIVYNIGLVFLSAYMTFEFAYTAWKAGYSLGCQPVDYSRSVLGLRMVNVCWWFFFSKVIEMLDTVIFILRKKSNQITFLHVFHHCTMIWTWYGAACFIGGGQSFFNALLNSAVHTVMYSYYGLSAFGPWIQPYLWWKRYITVIQLTQFVLIVTHSASLIFYVQPCDFPVGFCWLVFLYCILMFALFLHFYISSYLKQRGSLTRGDEKKECGHQNGHSNGFTTSGQGKITKTN